MRPMTHSCISKCVWCGEGVTGGGVRFAVGEVGWEGWGRGGSSAIFPHKFVMGMDQPVDHRTVKGISCPEGPLHRSRLQEPRSMLAVCRGAPQTLELILQDS